MEIDKLSPADEKTYIIDDPEFTAKIIFEECKSWKEARKYLKRKDLAR